MNEAMLTAVLWGLAAVVLGWTWLPAMISGLGGTRYTSGGTDDPAALDAASEPDYAFWHRQIDALGYEPVGPARMSITFHGPDWRFETSGRVFYSRSKHVFVFIQRQPPPMDVWWLTLFATCWQEGGILLTSNAVDEPPDGGETVIQGMETTDLAAVEELHLRRDAVLRSGGRRPESDGRMETLLKATARYARGSARRVGVSLGQTYLATHVLIHFFMSIPAAVLVGPGHWGVPLGNLFLGLLFHFGDHTAKRRAAAAMKAQLPQARGVEA